MRSSSLGDTSRCSSESSEERKRGRINFVRPAAKPEPLTDGLKEEDPVDLAETLLTMKMPKREVTWDKDAHVLVVIDLDDGSKDGEAGRLARALMTSR